MDSPSELVERFLGVDAGDLPRFENYDKPLELGLWVLWICKEKLEIKKLYASEIANLIRAKEKSVTEKEITLAFNRAGDKIHPYRENGKISYEIMKPGKEFLLLSEKAGPVQLFYFEPNRRFSSKRILAKDVLKLLNGAVRLVDPYPGVKTLDLIREIDATSVKFLTSATNLLRGEGPVFVRQLPDFKSEHSNVQIRSYSGSDMHDRYMLSDSQLVLLGHSIKDLGSKESLAIRLHKDISKDVFTFLTVGFDDRWNKSALL